MQITAEIASKVLSIVDAGLVKGMGDPKPGQMCVEAAVCFALGLPHGDDPQCVSRALRYLKIRLNDCNWSSNEARAKGLRRLAVAQLGSRDHLDDIEFAKRVMKLAIRKSVPEALRSAASIHKDPKHVQALRDAANKCESEPTETNLRAAQQTAYAAAYGADAAYAAAYGADAAYASAYAASAAADATKGAAAADATKGAYAASVAAYAAYATYAATKGATKGAARDKSLADFAECVVQILIEMNAPGVQWLVLTEAA